MSNNLPYTWVVERAVCSGFELKAAEILRNCETSHLGLFDIISSEVGEEQEAVLIQRDLLEGIYRDPGLNAERDLMVAQLPVAARLSDPANKRLLGIEGSGSIEVEEMQVNFTDAEHYGNLFSAIGVFTSTPDEEHVASGYLSVP